MTLTALSAAVWWSRLGPPKFDSDASQYLALARNLAQHGTFGFAPDAPSMLREPGYPLVLAAIFKVFGSSEMVTAILIPILQLLCVIMSAWFLKRITDTLFPAQWLGWALGVAWCLYPISAQYANLLLTETLATLLVTMVVYLALTSRWDDASSLKRIIAFAFTLSLLTLTRFTWFLLPLAIIIAAGFGGLQRGWALPPKKLLIACAIGTLVPAAWIVRNCITFGKCAPAERGAMLLYVHASKAELDATTRSKYVRSVLLGQFFVTYQEDPAFNYGAFEEDPDASERVINHARSSASTTEIDGAYAAEAFRLIRRHPLAYASQPLLETWKLLTPLAIKGPTTSTFTDVHPPAPFLPYAAALIAVRLWTLAFTTLCVFGAVRFGRAAWPIFLPVGYTVIIHSLLFSIPRYFLPVAPIAWLLAVAGAAPVIENIFRSRPWIRKT